jgi:ribosomal protein S18 acetylase RimI-like enzyme
MADLTVGPPTEADFERWRALFLGYAAFYHVELTDHRIAESWSWFFDPDRMTDCLLARTADGTPVGLAHYRTEDSPLRGTRGFLDDLFVDPAHRGSGAVDALCAELRRIGEQQGWPTLAWRTAENNYRARSVYDRYATTTGFLTYSMSLGA